jgi:hypothetical protein
LKSGWADFLEIEVKKEDPFGEVGSLAGSLELGQASKLMLVIVGL